MINRLYVRIAILILLLGPILLIFSILISTILNIHFIPLVFRRDILIRILVEFPIVIFFTPIALGIIVAGIITKPLRGLNEAIKDLQNRASRQLSYTGITEIDQIVDEVNKLADQLKTEEELRKNLISDTSHELNTPITALLGQLQAIKQGILPLNEERIDTLYLQTERLNTLVSKLNNYAQIRSNAMDIHTMPLNLYEEINNIQTMFENQMVSEKIILNNNVPTDYILYADKKMLQQILVNILQNAIKYSKGRFINISTTQNTINISDDGIGIGEDDIKYIFERFYRVEQSRNTNTGGMGLGLAIVKELVEAHGWEIYAKNNENKKGISFVIRLS